MVRSLQWNVRNLFSFIAVLILVAACGGDKEEQGSSGSAGNLGIVYDSTVPADQQALLNKDFNVLSSAYVTTFSQDDLKKTSLANFSNSSLQNWIRTRVRYIVGENYDYSGNATKVATSSYKPSVMANEFLDPFSAVTIMVNIGSAVYRAGKQSQTVYSLPVGGQSVVVKSTRVGIIQIGEGLFSTWSAKTSAKDSLANSLIRLSVIFHEGRHSDGNGTNAGFPHSYCASGDYAGRNSCESNLNGPYIVDAVMLKVLRSACTGCNNSELETFKAFQVDAESRLQSGAVYRDDRAEQIP